MSSKEVEIVTTEEKLIELENRIKKLEEATFEEYLTPKQLAERLHCSTNHIYVKIREGEIKVIKHLGSCVRIPMSQFKVAVWEKEKQNKSEDKKKDNKPKTIEDIKKLVWG